ncbi:PPC domain-containing DNA-binding protein [Limnobacter litoralis]|nr:PPC domain-containing DNA-binding protein [Limnobacter litoralis]
MNTLPLRLPPDADLRRALEEAAKSSGGSAFVVSGIGSLQGATLRLADANSDTQFSGPFELLSLSGSVSPDGAHLHMAVANAQGEVLGGHVCYGNIIRTTAEVLLINLPDWALDREVDEATGFKELVVRKV